MEKRRHKIVKLCQTLSWAFFARQTLDIFFSLIFSVFREFSVRMGKRKRASNLAEEVKRVEDEVFSHAVSFATSVNSCCAYAC